MVRIAVLCALAAPALAEGPLTADQIEAQVTAAVMKCRPRCPWVGSNLSKLLSLKSAGIAITDRKPMKGEDFDKALNLCAGCATYDAEKCGIAHCACDGDAGDGPDPDGQAACSGTIVLLDTLGVVCKAVIDNDLVSVRENIDAAVAAKTCPNLATTLSEKSAADLIDELKGRKGSFEDGSWANPPATADNKTDDDDDDDDGANVAAGVAVGVAAVAVMRI